MSSKTKADNFPLNETVLWTSFDLFNFLLEGDELLVTSEIDRFKCDPQIFDFVGGDDATVIINNMSVCLLYLGRLKEALSLLESNLTSNPEAFLQETQVLNLATLYELESSYAGQKKQSLLDLLSRHAGDGVNTACLKFWYVILYHTTNYVLCN